MKRNSVTRIATKILRNHSIQASDDQKLELSFSREDGIEIPTSNEKNNDGSYAVINGNNFKFCRSINWYLGFNS